jgi:tetratricopeptide (TPR) repeat protein
MRPLTKAHRRSSTFPRSDNLAAQAGPTRRDHGSCVRHPYGSSATFGRQALLIFSTALAVRLVHLWSMRSSPFVDALLGDGQSYDAWARQIAGGDPIGQDVFYQAPLYAYFLGAIYSVHRSLLLVRVCQAVIGAGACTLIGYAARNLFGKTAGLVSGLMLACYTPAVFFGGLIQKSVLDLFFLCLLLALLTRIIADAAVPAALSRLSTWRWRWLAAGVVLGALSLTRENALLFLPVMLVWIWLQLGSFGTERVSISAMLLAGVAAVLLPVGMRNRFVGGEFHLTTFQSGPNLFIGNNPQADGTYVPLRFGRGSPEYERLDATEIASRATGRTLSPGEVSRYWTSRALDDIVSEPARWLALESRKFRLLWNVTEVIDTESQESHEDYSPLLRLVGHVAHFGLLAPLACLGVWLTWGERRLLWPLHAMIVAYALSLLAFYVVARYRLPLVPFLVIFAAAAVVRGPRAFRSRPPVNVFVGMACIAVVAVFCNVPVASADMMRAVTYQNLGTTLQETGRLAEAAAAFEHALALEPEYAPAHNGLGSVRRQQGKPDQAIDHLEHALRLRPDFEDASFNLANALADRGELSQAIARYQELLRRRPDAVDVRSNLGIALVGADRLDEAIEQFRTAVALAPQMLKGHYNLGHALLTRGELDQAVGELSRAVQIDPTDASVHYELGNAHLAQQRFEMAVDEFRETIRLSPGLVEGHNNLGIALGSLGRLDDAILEFRAALEIDPRFNQARANLESALNARQADRGSRN